MMHLEEEDANTLKDWVVIRLKDISDADSDVLADYVLALVRTDTPFPQLKSDVLESLEDFLKENTTDFVNEVFQALQTGSYKPGYIPLLPKQHALPTTNHPVSFGQSNKPSTESRKRSYNDAGLSGPDPNSQYAPHGDRQKKQMRGRGGYNGRGNGIDSQRGGSQRTNSYSGQLAGISNGFPPMPNLSNMPQFDPNDPMAAIMTMQAMGFPPLPGMDGLLPQQMGAQTSPGLNKNGGKGVCRDYVNKGYCTRGDACTYQHINPVVMPGQKDEYDPKDSLLTTDSFSPLSSTTRSFLDNSTALAGHPNESRGRGRRGDRGRGRGHGGNDRAGFHKSNRAEFSQAGPNNDRSITSIVVEQIPEEKFSEEAVREFFSDFGLIETVTMQPYKRLAIVKYADYSFARAAYDSPRVIFDNRFVKVYWYKPGSVPTPSAGAATPSSSVNPNEDTTMKESSPPLDMEAFATAAAAAQAKLDAKKAALAATQSQREALEKQKADLAAKQAAEKEKLLGRLAAKGQSLNDVSNGTNTGTSLSTDNGNNSSTPKAGDSAHTLMLRAKVAELEAEAKRLGLPDSALSSDSPTTSTFAPRGRGRGRGGRGSYRGWEAFDSSTSYRGGRGRGGGGSASPFVPARGGGGGKYNLDLRTKRVAITLLTSSTTDGENEGKGAKWTANRDEALRQHLLGVGEFEDIVPLVPEEKKQGEGETLIIIFKDRPTAETFFYGIKARKGDEEGSVPGLGKVGVSWFNGALPSTTATAGTTTTNSRGGEDVDMDVGVNGGDNKNPNNHENGLENEVGGQIRSGHPGGGGVHANGFNEKQSELRGVTGDVVGGGGGGHDEGDYDVAEEEEDDSWMT